MKLDILESLEKQIADKSPVVFAKLQSGLTRKQIERRFVKYKVKGNVDSITALYEWRNGMTLDNALRLSGLSFVPQDLFFFSDLDRACIDYISFPEYVESNPALAVVTERFFPVFWNGSTEWLGVDLDPSETNGIVKIDSQSDSPLHQIFPSIERFLDDLVQSYSAGTRMHLQ